MFRVAESFSLAIPRDLVEAVADLIVQRLKPATKVEGPEFLTVEDAATYLGCSIDHVRTLYRRADIRAFRPGRRILIDRSSLDEYIRSVPA